MDLNRWLGTLATRRAHVFIAEIPGDWALRARTQDLIATRGWRQASSPADADVLAVCGAADDEFVEVIDRIWDQLPGPRARVDIRDVSSASDELHHAAGVLLDVQRQRGDAGGRERSPVPVAHNGEGSERHPLPDSAAGHGTPSDGSSVEAGHGSLHHADHGGHHHADHGSHAPHGEHTDHGGHTIAHGGHHMDHGDMEMTPGGIALAQGGQDRDGLEMDELHVRLGPFLAYWPAGLVLRCTLQGDVITASESRTVGSAHQDTSPDRWMQAAHHTDHLVNLLAVAGWPRGAARAEQLRKTLLGNPIDEVAAQKQIAFLAALIRRSRLLRWALRDLAPMAVEDIDRHELPAALAGDTYDRLLTRLRMVHSLISRDDETPQMNMRSSAIKHVLPALVEGLDLATARLVIAGLGIDTTAAQLGQHG